MKRGLMSRLILPAVLSFAPAAALGQAPAPYDLFPVSSGQPAGTDLSASGYLRTDGGAAYTKNGVANQGSLVNSVAGFGGARSNASPTSIIYNTPADSASADSRTEGVVWIGPNNGSEQIGVGVRASPSAKTGYFPLCIGYSWTVYAFNNGSFPTVASGISSGVASGSSGYQHFAIEESGTAGVLYLDGVQRATWTDATIGGGSGVNRLGLYYNGSSQTDTSASRFEWVAQVGLGGAVSANPPVVTVSGANVTGYQLPASGGTGPSKYQFQRSAHNANTWTNVGALGFHLAVSDAPGTGSWDYRTLAVSPADNSTVRATSTAVNLTVGSTLAAGTASLVSTGSGSASLACGAATGGTAPVTYQWFRSTAAGVQGSAVAGATSLTLNDSGLTNGATYYYTLVVTDAASNTAASNQVAATPSASFTTLGVAAAGEYWSPYNWFSDGGGPLQSSNVHASSTYARTNNIGAYVKLAVTGTTTFKLNVDLTDLNAIPGIVSAGYPELAYSYNGRDFVTVQLAAGVPNPVSLSGLSGTTQIVIYVKSINHNYDFWTTGANGVKVTGFTVDAGATVVPLTGYYAVRTATMIVWGDSIAAGYYVTSTVGTGTDATLCYVRYLAEALGAEVGVVAFGGQGYGHPGDGAVPNFYTSTDPANQAYQYYYNGQSRLVAGVLAPPPNYAWVEHGTNDGNGSTAFQANVQAFLGVARAVSGANAVIVQQVPFSRQNVSFVTGGFNGYKTASGDAKVYLVDAGASFTPLLSSDTGGLASARSSDGVHLNTRGNLEAAARCALQFSAQVAGSPSPGGGGGVFFPVNGGPVR